MISPPLLHGAPVRPVRDAIAAVIGLLAVSLAGLYLTYWMARQVQVDAVRAELLQLVTIAAGEIDADLHRRVEQAAANGSRDHLTALEPLVRIHRANNEIRDVYTAVWRNGQVVFVLDSAYVHQIPGLTREPDPIGTAFAGVDDDFTDAVRRGRAGGSTEPVPDIEGLLMSAYAPFADSAGTMVGTVGVDMRVAEFEGRLARVRNAALAGAGVSALFSTLAGGLVFLWRREASRGQERDLRAVEAVTQARDDAERLAEEARRANDVKTTFLRVMSHELRTPLNAILGFSELLQADLEASGQADRVRDVQRIRKSGSELLALVTDILEYARLESGRAVIQSVEVDAVRLVDDGVRARRAEAAAKGLALIANVDPDLGPFYSDPTRLGQILRQLLSNAVKFTDRGTITVTARTGGSSDARTFDLTVADTGIGIPSDKLAEVFEPFAQADGSTSRRYGGAGLGLAIARRLAEAMGGRLIVASIEQQGSTFRLSVPAPATPAPTPSRA